MAALLVVLLFVLGGSRWSAPAANAYGADPIAEARVIADELAARGRLTGAVEIRPTTQGWSNGSATFDFARDRCVVHINTVLLPTSPYRDRVGFRFFIYHELSHCELYRSPGGFFRFPELEERHARLLDDLVLFDTVDEPEERINLFVFVHELYADLRAAALLLEEGVPPEALRFMIALRGETPMDRVHDSSAALTRLLSGALVVPRGELETVVRAAVGESVLARAITPMFKGSEWQRFELAQALENRVRSIHGRMEAGAPWWNPDIWTATRPGSRMKGYPLLDWLREEEPGVVAGRSRDELIARWRAALYPGEDVRAIAADTAERLSSRMTRAHAEERLARAGR